MKPLVFIATVIFALALMLCGCGSNQPVSSTPPPTTKATPATLTITWAKWPPSDVLEQMAQEWGRANNTEVKCALFPWEEYTDKVFGELEKKGSAYDIVIGDSQWIGRGVDEGHYLEITDWLKNNVNLAEIEPAALAAFCEYPRNSARYYAAPCEIDADGFAYRKDLFEDPKEQAAFKEKYKRELKVPETWQQLKEIAEFFHRPEQKLYGVTMFTDAGGYDAVTMGFQQIMWAWGGRYCDDNFKVDGILNAPESQQALEFFRDLCKYTPPNGAKVYHKESMEAHNSGQVAMSMHYFALMPALVDKKNSKFADVTGFFAVPSGPKGRYASLGGQGFSIVKYASPEKQELAKKFIKWFQQTDTQKKWASHPGCFTANVKAMEDPNFFKAAPFNNAFADSLPLLRDFYNIPQYDDLLKSTQKHFNAAIIGGETPKESLDALAKEHTEILKKAGLLK